MNNNTHQSPKPNRELDPEYAPRRRALTHRNILTKNARFGPNMTPMVDVTLVILIFFMASATIAGPEWFLRADLPEIEDQAQQQSKFSLPTPILSADLSVRNDQVFVDGFGSESLPIETVIARISTMDPALADGLILGIRAKDDVPYAAVIAIQDAASKAGMRVAFR